MSNKFSRKKCDSKRKGVLLVSITKIVYVDIYHTLVCIIDALRLYFLLVLIYLTIKCIIEGTARGTREATSMSVEKATGGIYFGHDSYYSKLKAKGNM
jgi:hypothetical protein